MSPGFSIAWRVTRQVSIAGLAAHDGRRVNDELSTKAGTRMSVDARHSPFYAWIDYAAIRELVLGALDLSTGERLVLIKGLIPSLVDDIGKAAFEDFLEEARIKGQRYAEALAHPGVGGAARRTASEPLGGPVSRGEAHLPGTRDPRRPGGRALERQWEAVFWNELERSQQSDDASATS
jgi:hypothetical protein